MTTASLASRNHGCRPGYPFFDSVELPGWEGRSTWGYDEGIGSFYAQLWRNESESDPPEIWLSGAGRTTFPWPGSIVLELVERTRVDPITAVTGLGVADPSPILRSVEEITERMRELASHRDPYSAGQVQALAWTQGQADVCPGSGAVWAKGRFPSPSAVDAGHQCATGRVYRQAGTSEVNGADEALWWALNR